jgi:hypothetical protein
VVDDRQDLDEAEGGPQASQGRRLDGIELAIAEPATAAVAGLVGPPRCR